MAQIPDVPHGVDKDEWRRAVALVVASEIHEKSNYDPNYKAEQVVKTAARLSRFIREGI